MPLTREQVVEKARDSLSKHTPKEFGAQILIFKENDLKQNKEGYWVVPLYPSRNDVKTYQYYDIVAEVEEELQEKKHVDLVFVPVRPEA